MSETQKILVTGFDRFGYRRRPNRSSEVVHPAIKEKYGDLVETLVLPTARNIAAEQLIDAIDNINPAAIAMFGISAGSKVRLEERAKNRRFNITTPDNMGVRAIGRVIAGGPATIASTLPLNDIYNKLQADGVPTRLSNDAGTFVCNEVMYRALHHTSEPAAESVIPTGFIHLGNRLSDQLVEEASLMVVDELLQVGSSTK
jgi:pyroglutamyl-peptidase